MGQDVFNGDASAKSGSQKYNDFEQGVQLATIGFILQSIVSVSTHTSFKKLSKLPE